MTKNGPEFLIGWCDFLLEKDDIWEPRRKVMNEKNVRTTLDNTSDDIQEVRDDNGCDDVED
jgi:hypothetical protein